MSDTRSNDLPTGDARAGQAFSLARPASLKLIVSLPAVVALVVLALAIAVRVSVPFALEWQEPAMVDHTLRLLSGDGIYVAPTMDFAPFPYPPLFYWLGAVGTDVFGSPLVVLRLISVLGVVAIMAAMLRSFGRWPGLVAAGWFACMYGWTGFWFDVARVDSLALGLSAVSWALVLGLDRTTGAAPNSAGPARPAAVLAGVLAALAVLAKQTQLGLGIALALALLARKRTRRMGVAYTAALTGVLSAVVVWLELQTDGLFLWTTVDLLRGSPFHGPAILGFWIESKVVVGLPLLLALCTRVGGGRAGWTPTLIVGALTLVGTGWVGRAHEGGFDNTLLPVALASAFACGGPLRWVLGGHAAGNSAPARSASLWVASAAVMSATLFVFQDPRTVIPDEQDRVAYDAAAVRIAGLQEEGEVWQPISAIPPERSGLLHKMALVDLAKSREVSAAARLLGELQTSLSERRFSAIILDALPRDGWGDLAPLIEAHYEVVEPLGELPGLGQESLNASVSAAERTPLTPVTGAGVTPRWILRPRSR